MRLRVPASVVGATIALIIGTALPSWAADQHTVRSGDTLSHIAERYDVPGGWPALYKANRGVVGGNPHLIFPGQVLTLGGGSKATESAQTEPRQRNDSADADRADTVRPATGAVTSHYGMRTNPITGVYKLHSGTDFAYGDGRARAARAGKVLSAGWAGGYGYLVTIGHGDGVRTRYAHLAWATVNAGERVDAGDVIGRIGSTGYSTGPHLHFEVLINGEFRNSLKWLRR